MSNQPWRGRRHAGLRGQLAWALLACCAAAQAAEAPSTDAAPDCRCAPAGTPVLIEVADTLVSDERQPGETFALRLAQPLILDGTTVLPAGTPGGGEIVHAAKARGGGRPGELLLAARYLEAGGRRIALRGLKLGAAGQDRSGTALATSFVAGPFALFVHGSEMVIPAGTPALAKLAEAVPLPLSTPGGTTPPGATPAVSTPQEHP